MNHQKVDINVRISCALNNILSKIETQLSWGSSDMWTGRDFERLSDRISETTGHSLSVSTLKRIWGRTSQSIQPSVTTLDILAQFLGEDSWRAFDFSEEKGGQIVGREKEDKSDRRRSLSFLGAIILLGLILFSLYKFTSNKNKVTATFIDQEEVRFKLRKVTTGLPNTVVFHYDIGDNIIDSLELQQTWDTRKRILLDPLDSIVTTTYMSPGYFNAKLVADGQIIKTQNLYLPSDGLSAFVSTSEKGRLPLPRSLWQLSDEGFQLSTHFFTDYKPEEIDNLILVNLLPEPLISPAAFTAKIAFRAERIERTNPCSPISILLTGSQDVFMFDLGFVGCAGNFRVYLGGENISGNKNDLSLLGFEYEKDQEISIRKEGSKLWASLNEEEVLISEQTPDIGPLGGIRLFFGPEVQVVEMKIQDENNEINLMN